MRTVKTKNGTIFYIGKIDNQIIVISDKYSHPFDDPFELGEQLKIESEKISSRKVDVIFNLTSYHNQNYDKNLFKLTYDKNKQSIEMFSWENISEDTLPEKVKKLFRNKKFLNT